MLRSLLGPAFSILLALPLAAQSAVAISTANSANAKGHVLRMDANVVDLPMGDNQPSLKLTLRELMNVYKVPGLSVAVIENFRIAWANGYGVIEAGSTKPVTPKTLFQAGSISKPVAAAGALALVEQGKLALDEDVNRKLKSWQVPENDFTKTEKVTLRRLMSHTAGLTVHGFPGYDVAAPLPTVVQVLNGEKPANTSPVRVDLTPGTKASYSGGGVTIEQQLMVDVSGKPFPVLERELVLDKIGMSDSSYEQPLPSARAGMTAGGTSLNGKPVHGRWHIYPEMAAAGLWTTPTDLAKFAIEIALSRHGQSNRVLSEKMTTQMLTPVLENHGLGFFLDDDKPGQFGHGGDDEGFQALLSMNYETGQGIAIMADSNNGIAVGTFVSSIVAKEYGWKYKAWEPGAFDALMLIAKLKGSDAALRRYTELQKFDAPKNKNEKVEEGTLNAVGLQLLESGQEKDAIAILQRNVQEYPKSGNTYDSLAEAYGKVGQKALAIKNYERSLQLDPKNQNATDMVKKLKEAK